MMRSVSLGLLAAAMLMCGDGVPRRSVAFGTAVTEPVDWTQSAAIFIGIETFLDLADAPADVRYAADDAVDLAWMFTKELPSLLTPDRTIVVISGRPHKRVSQERLLMLRREGSVIADGIDAAAIYAQVRRTAKKVGPNGVLILFIATHGFTTSGAHMLLTPEGTKSNPKGVVLNDVLQAIPPQHGKRVLLFVDACRSPYAAMPSRLFEDLRFPGDYAIFAAAGPGGFAHGDDRAQNGFFTSAVIDGLGCRAGVGSDGYITPATLDVYVTARVKGRSQQMQRPEARFSGLTDLPLFACRGGSRVARIVYPRQDAEVASSDRVEIETEIQGLLATVIVCAASTGKCWKEGAATPAAAGEITRIDVGYGEVDAFRVHVALTGDAAFLRDDTFFNSVPFDRRADRVVYWLKPMTVHVKE